MLSRIFNLFEEVWMREILFASETGLSPGKRDLFRWSRLGYVFHGRSIRDCV